MLRRNKHLCFDVLTAKKNMERFRSNSAAVATRFQPASSPSSVSCRPQRLCYESNKTETKKV